MNAIRMLNRNFLWRLRILLILWGICGSASSPRVEAVEPPSKADLKTEIREPKLAEELKQRFDQDQQVRNDWVEFFGRHKLPFGTLDLEKLAPEVAAEFKSVTERMQAEDVRNLAWMKDVITTHGWPGKSLVGKEGAHLAWLLVQHADSDREFQKTCLEKMEKQPKGEVSPIDIAYLTDRILVGSGKKQKYGTQTQFQNGKAIPNPIEDEKLVDERRKEIGLNSLAEYLTDLEAFYNSGIEPKKKDEDAVRD